MWTACWLIGVVFLLALGCSSTGSNATTDVADGSGSTSVLTGSAGDLWVCVSRIDGLLTVAIGQGKQPQCSGAVAPGTASPFGSEILGYATAVAVDLEKVPYWIQNQEPPAAVLLLPDGATFSSSPGAVLLETGGQLDDLGEVGVFLIDLVECDLTPCLIEIDYKGKTSTITSRPTGVRPGVPDVPAFD